MDLALSIAIVASMAVSVVIVFALFIWAARKDGEHDREVQARTGVRRRTRLGR